MRKPPTIFYNPLRIMQRKSELQSSCTGSMSGIYITVVFIVPEKPSLYITPIGKVYAEIIYTFSHIPY